MKLNVLDTTLRDGEQTPGVSLSPEEKVRIAKALDSLGVDFIEAGSACTSPGEAESIKLIANEGLNAKVLSFSRVTEKEVDLCMSCEVDGLFLVAPTSEDHIKFKLKTTPEDFLGRLDHVVQYARDQGIYLDLCCEDGSRSDIGYLKRILDTVGDRIDRFTIADTVGASTPEKMAQFFKELSAHKKMSYGVHCHDDLGMAVANTIESVKAGADTIDVTINGLGERAGNTPLEEAVGALELLYGYSTNIKTEKIFEISRLIEDLTGVAVQANKALVGKNAFRHESGIHVDGLLKHAGTYQFVDPEYVGRKKVFGFGKHVGGKGLKAILDSMKISTTEEQFMKIFNEIKRMGDSGKSVTDADLAAVVKQVKGEKGKDFLELLDLKIESGMKATPNAIVVVNAGGKELTELAEGNGPVDAALNAIMKAVGSKKIKLEEYHVDAITGGTNATVSVSVRMKSGENVITASGVDTDIIMASVKAMVNGINHLLS
jgi:(R)-citramalate synthase